MHTKSLCFLTFNVYFENLYSLCVYAHAFKKAYIYSCTMVFKVAFTLNVSNIFSWTRKKAYFFLVNGREAEIQELQRNTQLVSTSALCLVVEYPIDHSSEAETLHLVINILFTRPVFKKLTIYFFCIILFCDYIGRSCTWLLGSPSIWLILSVHECVEAHVREKQRESALTWSKDQQTC
jgi:hypothetical protein